jgi:hypothetical protein
MAPPERKYVSQSASAVMPSAVNPGIAGMAPQGNMTAVYAMRRMMRQQAGQGRQRPGRVAPPPPPMKLKVY